MTHLQVLEFQRRFDTQEAARAEAETAAASLRAELQAAQSHSDTLSQQLSELQAQLEELQAQQAMSPQRTAGARAGDGEQDTDGSVSDGEQQRLELQQAVTQLESEVAQHVRAMEAKEAQCSQLQEVCCCVSWNHARVVHY